MTHDKEVTNQFKELTDIGMTPAEQDELWQSIAQEMKTMKPRKFKKQKRSNVFATGAAAVAAIAVIAVGIGVGIDKHVLSQTPTIKTTGASNVVNTSSNATGNSPTASNSVNNQAQGSKWQDVGKMYEVQGVITSVSGHSLGFNVSKNIKGANSAVTNPNYPFKAGSVVNIQFAPLLSPRVGDHVVLNVSQYATGGSPFWGVITSNYYTEQDGSYYNQSGQKLTLPMSGSPGFSGTGVKLLTGKNTPSAIPVGYKGSQPGLTFANPTFTPIEGFAGTLNGKKFVLDFYSNKPNGIAVGINYNNKPVYFGFGPSPMFDVLNFTGENVVLGSSSTGSYMAINLVTGNVNTNPSQVVSIKGYSGINPPNYVLGLPGTQYPVTIPYGK